jgi:hypothetical protein
MKDVPVSNRLSISKVNQKAGSVPNTNTKVWLPLLDLGAAKRGVKKRPVSISKAARPSTVVVTKKRV